MMTDLEVQAALRRLYLTHNLLTQDEARYLALRLGLKPEAVLE